jgi:hypothetical protein
MKQRPKIIVASLIAVALLTLSYFDVFRPALQPPVYLPPDAQTLLANADAFTLFSINPEPDSDHNATNTFESHEILGQLEIQSKDTRMELIDALNKGISAENRFLWPGPRALPTCFNPRHGIRAKKSGETIELLICFECKQIYIKSSSATNQLFLTTREPAATFNNILKDAGVPLATN